MSEVKMVSSAGVGGAKRSGTLTMLPATSPCRTSSPPRMSRSSPRTGTTSTGPATRAQAGSPAAAVAATATTAAPGQQKERRNPSITPRKFQRFFTPRPSRVPINPSAARRALRDLTAPALNRARVRPRNRTRDPTRRAPTPASSSPLKPISELFEDTVVPDELPDHDQELAPFDVKVLKRRKLHHATPDTAAPSLSCQLPTPLNTSPSMNLLQTPVPSRPALRSPIQTFPSSPCTRGLLGLDAIEDLSEDDMGDGDDDDHDDDDEELPRPVPLTRRGFGAHLLQRMTGGVPQRGHTLLKYPVSDWRMETEAFYSNPEDVHMCSSHEGAQRSIPFCVASSHNSSMIAVGDEEGFIRLLDSATGAPFSKIHLSLRAHTNAIIDVAFSDCDSLLATASGDQTGLVMDMHTQKPLSVLGPGYHHASLKQVRFQPGRGDGAVLATSGRDGGVHVWDLRCHGGPVQQVANGDAFAAGCAVNSIYEAHAHPVRRQTRSKTAAATKPGNDGATTPSLPPVMGSGDVARTGEVPGRIGEVSVTALQFLPAGREHLLLTACEADASIKLWDVRAASTSRNTHRTPVSFTAAPLGHGAAWRPFGISAMALGGDGARLYAVCKDSSVYAYSTSHLVLGHQPPELAVDPPRHSSRHYHNGPEHRGLGPLYRFRHPSLRASSFYVKAAVRPAADGRPELLAVGSSNDCAMLFPTDERYFRDAWLSSSSTPPSASASCPFSSSFSSFKDLDMFPGRHASATSEVSLGTPLVRGHEKEVSALTWTAAGELVTASDDYLVRVWRHSDQRDERGWGRARSLRRGGETEGRRWGCGWADVGEDWAGDDDDW